MKSTRQPTGTERHRDEQRDDDKPKVAGRGDWRDADAADLSQLAPPEEDELEDPAIESGGERAGMGRGEKPRKSKEREP